MNSVRIDKWLWAARFFKTRTLAAKACELNRVSIAGQPVKASREVRAGDVVRVRTESTEYELQVVALSDTRGPAPVARELYRETDESRFKREAAAEQRRSMPQFQVISEGRPSKKERRRYDEFRGR